MYYLYFIYLTDFGQLPLIFIRFHSFFHHLLLPPLVVHICTPGFSPFWKDIKRLIRQLQFKINVEDFMADYLLALDEAKNLTYQDLVQKFPEAAYIDNLGYTADQTNYYDLVEFQMGLTSAEEQKINENGFVISTQRITHLLGKPIWIFFIKIFLFLSQRIKYFKHTIVHMMKF